MSRDCPHRHCNFFVTTVDAHCPGCGLSSHRSPRAWLLANRSKLLAVVVASAVLVTVLRPLQNTLVAGIAIVLTALCAVFVALRLGQNSPEPTSLDVSYQQAIGEAEHWLTTWSQLFATSQIGTPLCDAERLLLDQALSGAADGVAASVARRNDLGAQYLANAFERLDLALATRGLAQGNDHIGTDGEAVRAAITIIERFLDTLWIDESDRHNAVARIASAWSSLRSARLAGLATTVRLLEPVGASPTHFAPAPWQVDQEALDAERFRIRAEQALLRDAPWSPLRDPDETPNQ